MDTRPSVAGRPQILLRGSQRADLCSRVGEIANIKLSFAFREALLLQKSRGAASKNTPVRRGWARRVPNKPRIFLLCGVSRTINTLARCRIWAGGLVGQSSQS